MVERNMELRDELFALRDATAQSYAHAEGMKARWADIEKAQGNLYQVSRGIIPDNAGGIYSSPCIDVPTRQRTDFSDIALLSCTFG